MEKRSEHLNKFGKDFKSKFNELRKEEENKTVSNVDRESSKNFKISMLNTCDGSNKAKLERGMFLDKIRKLAPICISKLARELKCSRSKLYYVLRDFEFAGLVETKIILDGNVAKRIVVIPDYKRARLGDEDDN